MRKPLVLLLVAVLLSGCASIAPASPQHLAARERVEQLASDLSHDRYDDIEAVARAAVDVLPGDLVLFGMTTIEPAATGEVFGALEVVSPEVEATTVTSGDLGPFCFTVDFTYYGATQFMSGWDGPEGIRSIDCPADMSAFTPPADETVYPVLAANALDAATSVLSALGSPLPTSDEIAASITALLEAPTDPLQSAAPPSVAIEDGAVGVAMGDADDCMLLKLEDGVVEQLYAAPVLLQPGELGCTGGTALYPDLSSPH